MMPRTSSLWAIVVFVALAAAEPAPQFVEITEEAGLDFRYVNGTSGHKYMVEAVGSGAAFFDSDVDIFVSDSAPAAQYGAAMPTTV